MGQSNWTNERCSNTSLSFDMASLPTDKLAEGKSGQCGHLIFQKVFLEHLTQTELYYVLSSAMGTTITETPKSRLGTNEDSYLLLCRID